MLIFDILKHGSSTLNFNSSDNIARIIKCDISKSKLALSTCNGVYFSSAAPIVFTLYEIKQVKIFLGHPVNKIRNTTDQRMLKDKDYDMPKPGGRTLANTRALPQKTWRRGSPGNYFIVIISILRMFIHRFKQAQMIIVNDYVCIVIHTYHTVQFHTNTIAIYFFKIYSNTRGHSK